MHNIIFAGELVAGFEQEEVRANLGKLFRINDDSKLDRLFSGAPVTVKKNLDAAQARQYEAVLSQAGALCRIEPPLHQFADQEEAQSTEEPALNFQTIALMAGTSEQEASATASSAAAPVPATPSSRLRKLWLAGTALLVLLLGWYLVNTLDTLRRAQQLEGAAATSDAQFEQQLEAVEDPQMRDTMKDLREMLKEAELEAQKYDARESEAAGQ